VVIVAILEDWRDRVCEDIENGGEAFVVAIYVADCDSVVGD
jgi:hypothetical protein